MILDKYCLNGKVALVTGGSKGIGRAIALAFAEAGADVIVASRSLTDLQVVASEISALGRRSLAVAAHIGHMEEVSNLVDKAKSEFGRIDILVNNAGGSPTWSSVLNADERLWDAIMNLNLKGLFFLSQGVARIMKEHGGGNIINISSWVGARPEINLGIYCISKSAVNAATQVLALELAPYNIRVNAIAPGNIIHTRLGDSMLKVATEYMEATIKRTPWGRMGEPEEIAGAAVYLASDASTYVTGEILLADGGVTLG